MSSRPLILIVDDRPHGLSALLDAIGRRYGSDYRTVGHLSAHAALDELERARRDGEEVALVIADQWMPEMTGRELLRRAHDLHADAQRALLVGWGDTRANETILQGCALGDLDNYILKPWSPAEVHLYPVIGEFLAAWTRMHGPRLELVRVVSEEPSARATELCDLLERNGVPYGRYAADSEVGRRLIDQVGLDRARLPSVILLDGRTLHAPSNAALADALGASDLAASVTCDLAIVGAGPCGLAAAVSAASEGLRTVVIEREAIGGQAGTTSLIRNFLGFPRGISGTELAQRAYQQAWLFGARYVLARRAVKLHARGWQRILTLDDKREIAATAVVIATGAEYRRLGMPRIDRFEGVGVFYNAGADIAIALRGQDVVVCGGGNSAGQAVVHLAKTARRVVHVVRADSIAETMSSYLVQDIMRLPNVEHRFATEVVDADGTAGLGAVTLRHHDGSTDVVRTPALFVMIGARPHTGWLEGTVERERNGFLLTGAELDASVRARFGDRSPMLLETSVPGVFAAGDVRHGSTKRMSSAVGEGAVAIRLVHEYLRLTPTPDWSGAAAVPPAAERLEHADEALLAPPDLR